MTVNVIQTITVEIKYIPTTDPSKIHYKDTDNLNIAVKST